MIGLLLAASVLLPASAAAAPPKPFGHDCQPKNGVLFCPTVGDAQRVKTFDGTPLDVDVTLPAQGDGPFPTIVMMHGFGGSKTDFEQTSPEGDSATTDTLFHYNNVHFAQRGYAVVNYSARGFGRSCGQQKTAPSSECASGFIRLADSRFEVRDTQTLLGLLADQGVSQPTANGVTGISYGGGQSMQLAFLKDRIRMPDGSFTPWTSPAGKPMAIAAAYPRWPWSDLVASLTPNGRYLDFEVSGPEESRSPLGVPISSYVQGLFAVGSASGYFCGQAVGSTPCTDADADISTQFVRLQQGEPEDAAARAIADTTYNFRSGTSIPGTPSPLLMQSGWTDDLFPVSETLRIYNRVRAADPAAPVSLQYSDLGHSRGSNKTNSDRAFNDQGTAFFDAHLKGVGAPPAPGSVNTFTQTCPKAADAGGPFTAATWAGVHPGAVRIGSTAVQTVSSAGGNPDTARRFDPVGGTSDACQTVPDETAPGTATYRGSPSQGFTLLGRPTVTARIQTTGRFGQIASRLWDVAPDGTQRLISRGVYRLLDNQSGPVTFQLHGNGYRFEPGHTPKLELLGRDNAMTSGGALSTGYLRASNGAFTVAVSDLTLELPTAEAPNGGQIVAPMFAIDPAGAVTGPGPRKPLIRLSVTPKQVRSGTRTRFSFQALQEPRPCVGPSACGAAVQPFPLRGALVTFGGRTARTGNGGRVTITRRFVGSGKRVARATKSGFVAGRARVLVTPGRKGGGQETEGGDGSCDRFTQTSGRQRYRCQRGNR
jgi:hypothetical protein